MMLLLSTIIQVGMMLNLLDELDIAGDTIVIYSTDYGPHMSFSADEV